MVPCAIVVMWLSVRVIREETLSLVLGKIQHEFQAVIDLQTSSVLSLPPRQEEQMPMMSSDYDHRRIGTEEGRPRSMFWSPLTSDTACAVHDRTLIVICYKNVKYSAHCYIESRLIDVNTAEIGHSQGSDRPRSSR